MRRAAVWLANRAAGSGHYVLHRDDRVYLDLEQPTAASNTPRWGHGQPPHLGLSALLDQRRTDYEAAIDLVAVYAKDLAQISRVPRGESDPTWANEFFTGIDGASLYCFLRSRNAGTYLEVGSGHSTRFAARAKADGQLGTQIISIDPEPRAAIDALCDTTIRARLEDADLSVFDQLEAGDVVLFDGSHRLFMNNDVATFFLDVLPRIIPGVLVGVHDIALPEDYHVNNAPFYWTEQYMLAMALLAAGPDRMRPVLPCHHACIEPSLKAHLDRTWDAAGLGGINAYGSTFWFQSGMAA